MSVTNTFYPCFRKNCNNKYHYTRNCPNKVSSKLITFLKSWITYPLNIHYRKIPAIFKSGDWKSLCGSSFLHLNGAGWVKDTDKQYWTCRVCKESVPVQANNFAQK
jgi:hypothetical protein